MDVRKLIPESDIRNWVGPFEDKEYYYNLGKEQAEKIIDWLNIRPNYKILDMGCGCGRIAIHFLDYLNKEGKYIGIDSNKELLLYCADNLSAVNKNFEFQFLDVYNGAYSKEGQLKAKYVFLPIRKESIDSVILWSVFTHMYMEDIDSYLKEINRVLKEKGMIIVSLNLLNSLSMQQIKDSKAKLNIKYDIDDYIWSLDKETPERGFGHSEDKIKELFLKNNFDIKKIVYGSWSMEESEGEFHDCIVAEKHL